MPMIQRQSSRRREDSISSQIESLTHELTGQESGEGGLTCPRIIKGYPGPTGIPHNCSIAEWLLKHLKKADTRTVLIDCLSGREYSGAEVHDRVLKLATVFQDENQLKQQDAVCFYAETQPNYIIALLAVWSAGGVFTGCDPTFPQTELSNVIEDTQPKFIITSRANLNKSQLAAAQNPGLVKKIIIIEELNSIIDQQQTISSNVPFKVDKSAARSPIAAVMFTSGTTGRPKPVIKLHSDLVLTSADAQHPDVLGLNELDCAAYNMPAFHSGALYYLCHFIVSGCRLAVFYGYDQELFCQYVEKYQITFASLLHSRLVELANSNVITRYDLSSLRDVFYEGANLPENVGTKIVHRLRIKYLRQLAGQSEVGWVGFCPRSLNDPESKSVGWPAPGLELKIVDVDTRQMLGPFNVGEVCVRSSHTTVGYLNRDELTSNLYDESGFLKTGDVGYYDQNGFLFMVDRIKFIISMNRKIIVPMQIEMILREHKRVDQAAVIPVGNNKYGQVPKAFITLKKKPKDDENQDEVIESIKKYVDRRVEQHQRLRGGITVLDQMPISPNGRGRIRKSVLLEIINNYHHSA